MTDPKETRSQALLQESTVRKVKESLTAMFEQLIEDHVNSKIIEMLEAVLLISADKRTNSSVEAGRGNLDSGTANSRSQNLGTNNIHQPQDSNTLGYYRMTSLVKIDFPRFSGSNVDDWLFRCEQIFFLDQTPEDLKVSLASMHMEGQAFTWHQSLIRSEGEVKVDWNRYKEALKERFTEITDDPMAQLKKLQEIEGIVEYHEKFEQIMARISLKEAYLVSFYLAGLQDDTEMHVRMFQPQSIRECFFLGRLYESAHPRELPTKNFRFSGEGNSVLAAKPVKEPARKVLTTKEMENREAKGLCYFNKRNTLMGTTFNIKMPNFSSLKRNRSKSSVPKNLKF